MHSLLIINEGLMFSLFLSCSWFIDSKCPCFLVVIDIVLGCMKIGGHGSLIACVAPGISIQSLTQSLFLTPTCRDTQLLYKSNKNL